MMKLLEGVERKTEVDRVRKDESKEDNVSITEKSNGLRYGKKGLDTEINICKDE